MNTDPAVGHREAPESPQPGTTSTGGGQGQGAGEPPPGGGGDAGKNGGSGGGGGSSTPSAQTETIIGHTEHLRRRLANAERLMGYAADIGEKVDDTVREPIIAARIAEEHGRWTPIVAQNLLAALTTLTGQLRPVTGESLRLCADDAESDRTTRFYKRIAFWLAAVIVPFSLATFITSGISKDLRDDLKTANELAVTLTNELRPVSAAALAPGDQAAAATPVNAPLPPGVSQKDVIEHLVEFAALIRAINSNARHLNYFVFSAIPRPDANLKLELNPKLPNFYESAAERVGAYQQVRSFAKSVDSVVEIFYGAFAACVLPVLYALLGACAYCLRQFEEQVKTYTLKDEETHVARFLISGIAGAVIGLFNNFQLDDGAKVSPLALAFLVGYAADVFFTFLEALIQSFSRKGGPPAAKTNTQSNPPPTPVTVGGP